MKLENKVVWPFVIFLISIIIIELIFFNFVLITKRNYGNIMNHDTRFESQENILAYYDIIRETSFQNYLKLKEDRFIDKHNKYVMKSEEVYQTLVAEISNEELRENYKANFELFKEITRIEKGIIEGTIPQTYLLSEEYLLLKNKFDESRDFPKEFYQFYVKEDVLENIRRSEIYENVMISVIVLTIILIFFEFFIIKRDVVNPTKKISRALANIRKENFDTKIRVEGTPAIANVMKDINKTSSELKKSSVDLKSMVRLSIAQLEEKKCIKNKKKLPKKMKDIQKQVTDLENMLKLSMIAIEDMKKKKN